MISLALIGHRVLVSNGCEEYGNLVGLPYYWYTFSPIYRIHNLSQHIHVCLVIKQAESGRRTVENIYVILFPRSERRFRTYQIMSKYCEHVYVFG